jgi:hypothetical protein
MSNFAVGDRVKILRSNEGLTWAVGRVTDVRPDNAGCMVQPEGMDVSFGWGFTELVLDDVPVAPKRAYRSRCLKRWERIMYPGGLSQFASTGWKDPGFKNALSILLQVIGGV